MHIDALGLLDAPDCLGFAFMLTAMDRRSDHGGRVAD
jgi:hypothetical protein